MKNTGSWLDKEKAYIVTIDNDIEKFETVQSNIDHYNIHGGSGTSSKEGPQDVVQDSRYLERENHQFNTYFQTIIDKVKDTNSIVIFGSAQTNERLAKTLQKNYNALAMKIKAVEKSDSMTENQVKAYVRDFFASS
ncbi:hypothetical protein DFQ09_11164 [Winogradskyella pacifica]|uniref:Protein required for attachment to host cells n=1 Tax=Winogradskyella pacifica TaxID=664642 RepID=A0A3D9LMC9_9FLAO|nr:hypothetical protein [Winogradskyella pacifica]REE07734.1 hypothetical protein DFQ09_11164 [Winogradskyella pacifica]